MKNDFELNPNNLAEEILRQSGLIRRYGKKFAVAKSESVYYKESLSLIKLDQKTKLDIVRAKIARKARKNYEKLEIKNTEKSIEEYVITTDEYFSEFEKGRKKIDKALKKLTQAIEQKEVFETAINALQHKKSMLESYLQGKLNDLFGDVNIPSEIKTNVDEKKRSLIKRNKERTLSKLNKKKL